MPDLVTAIQQFFGTATVLEAILGAIGTLSLITAGVAFVFRIKPQARKTRVRPGRRKARAAKNAYEEWNPADGIFFAPEGEDDFRRDQFDEERFDQDDRDEEADPRYVGRFDGVAVRGEGALDAVRKRPLEFLAGALAAGFAAGLILPIFSGPSRQARLLERLIEENEERRGLLRAQREAERFLQAREK